MQVYGVTGFPASEKDKLRLVRGIEDVTKQFPGRTYGFVHRVGTVETGKRSKYVFIGDSFSGHLRTGLHVIGLQRKVWFQVHSMPSCPLWPRDIPILDKRFHRTPYVRCLSNILQMWREIQTLPSGSTIMVSNLWCKARFDDEMIEFRKLVFDMSERVKKMGGHKLVIVGEPPGMLNTMTRSYFSCAVFWQLPIGKFMAGLARYLTAGRIRIRADGTSCVDIRKGLQPDKCQIKQAVQKRKQMRLLPHVGFIDVWSTLCGEELKNWSMEAVCKLPVYFEDKQLYNVGYTFDGFHLSGAGSYYIGVNILDKFMFGNTVKA